MTPRSVVRLSLFALVMAVAGLSISVYRPFSTRDPEPLPHLFVPDSLLFDSDPTVTFTAQTVTIITARGDTIRVDGDAITIQRWARCDSTSMRTLDAGGAR